MVLYPEDLIKIALALFAGGMIGVEREFRDKAAGFRTMIFISLGAVLFTIFSVRLAGDKEPTRIAANIVVGVGFLGAGVILRETGGRVTGLTTAATIWLVAALGMGIGGGAYALSAAAAIISFLVLWLFPRLEMKMEQIHSERHYEIASPLQLDQLTALQKTFSDSGLRVRRYRQAKSGEQMVSYWYASGPARSHDRLTERLLADPLVLEFKS